jgi:hypothetical protein
LATNHGLGVSSLCDAQTGVLGRPYMLEAIGFLVAVAAVSAVIFVLTTRAENAGLRRARARGGASYDGGGSSDSDSWSSATWVGYHSSVQASYDAADSAACTSGSSDSGSFDSGGGGDCSSSSGGSD